MSWASTAPAAVAGLVATLDALALDDTTSIADGPVLNGSGVTKSIHVTWVDEQAPEAITGQFTVEGYAVSPDREQYTINCAIRVLQGSGNAVQARTDAFDLLAQVGGAIAASKTLGGAVMMAMLGAWTLTAAQGKRGAEIMLRFGVDCDAFTQR